MLNHFKALLYQISTDKRVERKRVRGLYEESRRNLNLEQSVKSKLAYLYIRLSIA